MTRDYLIKPMLDTTYPIAAYGKGIYIYDQKGREFIDGSSGAVTASIGHSNPEVIAAMHEQAKKVSFTYRSQFTNEPAEKLARKLSDLAPGDVNWSFFVNSGSEAIETAMKIAIQYWQEKGYERKNKMISRWTSYHGITLGALSVSGHVSRRKRFVPLLKDFPVLSPPYCYRCPFQCMNCEEKYADEFEQAIQRIGADHIAAFIAEPIIGAAAGAVSPPHKYFRLMKEVCERYQILFISDEVMTGIARTGRMFAMQHWGVVPDLIVLGKGMSAGYAPMAATLVSDRVMGPILEGSKLVMSGHTYSANPLSTAVSLAVLKYIEDNHVVQAAEQQGEYLYKKLLGLKQKYSVIGDVRGKGLLLGLEFVSDISTKKPFVPQLQVTQLVVSKAFEHGLLIYPAAGGVDGIGDAVIVAPPLIITQPELDKLVNRLDQVLKEVEKDLKMMVS